MFLINVPVGIAAAWRAHRRLAESTAADGGARPDLPGALLLVVGVGLIALAIVGAESGTGLGTSAPLSLWPALGGVAALGAFVAWARGRPNAALDLTLFDDAGFRWVSVSTIVFGAAFTAIFLSSFLFQMGVWGWSQSLAGLAQSALASSCASQVELDRATSHRGGPSFADKRRLNTLV